MKVLIDTNILLDVILLREPHLELSRCVLQCCLSLIFLFFFQKLPLRGRLKGIPFKQLTRLLKTQNIASLILRFKFLPREGKDEYE